MSPNAENVVNMALKNRYKYVERTKSDVFNAIKQYRGMSPKLDKFVFNDGSERELLNLNGTIPVRYKGNLYNIPICIWLLDNHPYSPPMVYVNPTADMLVRASRSVDQNGKVYLPYLHEWNPDSSELLALIQVLIVVFSEMPPVYAKPKNASPAHFQTPYPTQPASAYMPMPSSTNPLPYPTGGPPVGAAPQPMYPPYPSNPPMSTGPNYPLYPSANTPYPSQQPYPPSSTGSSYPPFMPGAVNSMNAGSSVPQSTGTITEDHIRASLISAVGDRVRARLRDVYGGAQAEVSVLRQQKSDLNSGKVKLEGLMTKLAQEQSELDKNIRILREKESEFNAVLSKLSETTEPLDVDEAVTTTAPLYKQLLLSYAEDQATQDAIYYLGDALRRDVIDLDAYLKHVRSLSRKQFQLRAIMGKCRVKAHLPG